MPLFLARFSPSCYSSGVSELGLTLALVFSLRLGGSVSWPVVDSVVYSFMESELHQHGARTFALFVTTDL